jgi:signal peptidase II
MLKNNFKRNIIYIFIFILIFAIDRFSKLYILNLVEMNDALNIYVASFLNFYLIWNKGIAFGLFSFDQNFIYNFITFLITTITIIVLIIAIKSRDYKGYFFMSIFSGSVGNLYDRIYYSAVPDFIDFHLNDFHWFIFNVADIFISLGVICLIFVEIFFKKKINEKS